MRRLILMASWFILAISGQGCQSRYGFLPENEDYPDIHFEKKIYDFGIAGQQEKIVHNYAFKNAGKKPLIIEVVKSSCGCVATLVSSKEVPPGAAGVIEAIFETGKRNGQQRESIYVQSNDPDGPEIELEIVGIVKTEVAIDPEFLCFSDVEKGKTITKTLKLIQIGESELGLDRVEVANQYFSTHVSRFKDERHKGFEIDVVLRPDAPVGQLVEVMTLHTNLKKRPRIDVPIYGNVIGRIRVKPQMVSLGTLKKGSFAPCKIEVTCVDHEKYDILKVISDPPIFSSKVSRVKNNGEFEIVLKVDEGVPAGRVAGEIHIYTDDTDQSLIKVPVYGLITK
jgi:hypothetical protein